MKTWVIYAAVALTAAFFNVGALKLWHANIAIPPYYADGGDVYTNLAWAKSLLEHWNIYNSTLLNAPLRAATYEFPYFCASQLPLQLLLDVITGNAFIALNIVYFVSIPAQALSCFYALRRLDLSPWTAFAPAILFAFLPRFGTGENRTDVPHFWIIPLSALICLLVARGDVPFVRIHSSRFSITKDGWIVAALAVVTGLGNEYYAAFTVALLAMAALLAAAKQRSATPVFVSAALATIIITGFALQLAPALVYKLKAGANTHAFTRFPEEAQIYGLQIAQLVLPIENHRGGPYLAGQRAYFDAHDPYALTESAGSSLGAVATVGFLAILAVLFLRFGGPLPYDLEGIALLNLWAILITTISGLGSIFNYFITPDIRAYNRFSIFVAFFALAGLAQIVKYSGSQWNPPVPKRWRFFLVSGLATFGVWDQSSPTFVPPYALSVYQFTSDAQFVAAVEAQIGSGAAFELPWMRYPESPASGTLSQGGLFRPYLHAKTLRISYGAVEGRDPYTWQRTTASLPPGDMIREAVLAGFDGFIVFREGYADRGVAIDTELAPVLGEPIHSPDDSLEFYSLKRLRAAVVAADPTVGAPWYSERLVRSVEPTFGPEFVFSVVSGQAVWRTALAQSSMTVRNSSDRVRPLLLRAEADLGPNASHLTITGGGSSQTVTTTAGSGPRPIMFKFNAPPGDTTLHLSTVNQSWTSTDDSQPVLLRLLSPDVRALDIKPPTGAAEAALLRAIGPDAVVDDFGSRRIRFVEGCYPLESAAPNRWNWCGRTSILQVESAQREKLTFSATVGTMGKPHSTLAVDVGGKRRTYHIVPSGMPIRLVLDVAPNQPASIRFHSDATSPATADTRTLVVQLINPSLE